MEAFLELECPGCRATTRKALDWLQQHSECRCEHCGGSISVGTSVDTKKRTYNSFD
jgi:hypothetical protein